MLGLDVLENVFEFKYLGHLFQADGCCWQAMLVRLAIAKTIFSKLFRSSQCGTARSCTRD